MQISIKKLRYPILTVDVYNTLIQCLPTLFQSQHSPATCICKDIHLTLIVKCAACVLSVLSYIKCLVWAFAHGKWSCTSYNGNPSGIKTNQKTNRCYSISRSIARGHLHITNAIYRTKCQATPRSDKGICTEKIAQVN